MEDKFIVGDELYMCEPPKYGCTTIMNNRKWVCSFKIDKPESERKIFCEILTDLLSKGFIKVVETKKVNGGE